MSARTEWARLGALLVGSAALILWLGRHLTFFGDELSFFEARPGWLEQWNSHWSTSLYAVLSGLEAAFGRRYYLPFHATLVGVHVVAVAALYALVRGRPLALGFAALLALLGTASQDLFWAWQLGFVGSTAAGLIALLLLTMDRPGWAAAALLVAVTFSGIGLPFVAACAAYAAATRPRSLAWVALPAAAFIAWRILFAPTNPDPGGELVTAWSVISYSAQWTVDAIGSTYGIGAVGGAMVGVVAVVWAARARAVSPLLLAAIVGLVAEFFVIALVRSGVPFYIRPRYLYPAAAFILLASAELFALASWPLVRKAGVALLALGIVSNVALLLVGPFSWGPNRYLLPDAWGCVPIEVIPDNDGEMRRLPPEGRC